MRLYKIFTLLVVFSLTIACSKKKENPPVTLTTSVLSGFNVAPKHIGDPEFALIAPVSTSQGAFTYTSSNPAVAVIKGDSIVITGVGSATITAKQAAWGGYTAGSISSVFVVSPSIYIGGYTYTPGGYLPAVWKNGDTIKLAGYGLVNSIISVNDHLYVAGSMANGGAFTYPGYWLDGVQHIFTRTGGAAGIAVLGSDIYVAGYDMEGGSGGSNQAAYWKNGVETTLTNPFNCCGQIGTSTATGIAVSNNQVFICGSAWATSGSFSSVVIWKTDGTLVAYSKPTQSGLTDTSSTANGMLFQGTDLYVYGATSYEYGNSYLTYWKNGAPTMLSTAAPTAAQFSSMLVQGGNVIFAGTDNINSTLNAAYWTNGVETILAPVAAANGITSDGTNIFISGNLYQPGNYATATPVYWLNGTLTYLNGPASSTTTCISIQEN